MVRSSSYLQKPHATSFTYTAAQIRELIDSGRLAGAGRLGLGKLPPERELAERYGVTRRILRQALAILEAEGRISRQQGRGTFATDARRSSENLVRTLARLSNPIDAMETRIAIEPQQARLAALRATNGDIERLLEAVDASRNATDALSYEKADAAFHRRIAAAARNPTLIAVFDAVLQVSLDGKPPLGQETSHCSNERSSYAADHRRILLAIVNRDAARAATSMHDHLEAVHARILKHTSHAE